MISRRLYDDRAERARLEAEAALSLAVEYVSAIDQIGGMPPDGEAREEIEFETSDPGAYGGLEEELSLDGSEADRYEESIAIQLEEAEEAFEDGLDEDVIYDRRRGTHVIPDADRGTERYYNTLDDAYIAIAATIDVLETVGREKARDPMESVSLDREYPSLEGSEGYEEHLEAVGLADS